MPDFVASLERDSARIHELVSLAVPATPVPSCPEWTVADLTWHLAEVQHLWASVVEDLLPDIESYVRPARPDDGELPAMLRRQSARLLEALSSRGDDESCWSWHPLGRSVGWVRRRQAHEALIHRVDAELAVGAPSRVDPEMGADGVDEILTQMMDIDDLPDWARFEPEGSAAVIEVDGGRASWSMTLGRFVGESPVSGNSYDFPAIQVAPPVERPAATLRGSGADVDLWLWGRGPLEAIEVEGDRGVAAFIRAAAVEATQ